MCQVTSGDLREGSRKQGFDFDWMLLRGGGNAMLEYPDKSYPECRRKEETLQL